eukprot:2595294-Amphidinium_carterae.1
MMMLTSSPARDHLQPSLFSAEVSLYELVSFHCSGFLHLATRSLRHLVLRISRAVYARGACGCLSALTLAPHKLKSAPAKHVLVSLSDTMAAKQIATAPAQTTPHLNRGDNTQGCFNSTFSELSVV